MIPWTVAYQAPPSIKFSRQKYWSGLPFPSPLDLQYPEIEPRCPVLQADALLAEPPGMPNKASSLVEDHYDRPLNSPGENCGVGSLSFLPGIIPTQGSNPVLQHCRQILYQLSHKGSCVYILETNTLSLVSFAWTHEILH